MVDGPLEQPLAVDDLVEVAGLERGGRVVDRALDRRAPEGATGQPRPRRGHGDRHERETDLDLVEPNVRRPRRADAHVSQQ